MLSGFFSSGIPSALINPFAPTATASAAAGTLEAVLAFLPETERLGGKKSLATWVGVRGCVISVGCLATVASMPSGSRESHKTT